MHIPSLIEKKRDGGRIEDAEIAELIAAYASGAVPDYQMSAFAMAVFFSGMSDGETSALTAAMRDSGRVFRWPEGSPPKVDKHSTGGIGDKVSLVLAPLLACESLWVPMVSGRGLGITGGTLDKLESIPGFNVHLDEAACLRQIEKIGVFMAGQTEDFCPADKRLYALRDVTATVPSRPLIIASIMSKKLAESLDRLVLDVKFGSGAFMKTREDAELLAAGLAAAGEGNGVRTSFLLSPMDEPLGRTVGNALEVREAVETLQGNGPDDLVAITLDLAAAVSDSPRGVLAQRLRDGSAWRKFLEMVEAQGGDPRAFENWDRFHPAPVVRPFPAPQAGVIAKMDAGRIGVAAVQLGAGRHKADDAINHAVGFSGIRKTGGRISKGEPLLWIHAASEADADAAALAVDIEVR
ncbi:MAG: thymidine phosphorylase [Verrucomicrobiota bacterium]